jgi:hypothetical protein
MSRVKFGPVSILAMLAALVVCGIAASGASAEFKLTEKECKGGEVVNFCYEKEKTGKLFEFEGTEEFELLALLGTQHILFESKLGGETIHIVCKAVDAEHTKEIKEEKEILAPDGLILQPKPLVENALLEFHLNFLECVLEGAIGKKCAVAVSEVTVPLVGDFDELVGSKPPFADDEILFKPVKGTTIIGIPFKNNGAEKCPATIIGTRNVTGEILCFVDAKESEALEDLEEHELICDPERGGQAGKLFLASSENPATLLAEVEIALLTVDLWSISNEA